MMAGFLVGWVVSTLLYLAWVLFDLARRRKEVREFVWVRLSGRTNSRLDALRDAIAILEKARIESTDEDEVWKVLNHAGDYLKAELKARHAEMVFYALMRDQQTKEGK